MWYARPKACGACTSRKQKCVFPTTQSSTCLGCKHRGVLCTGQHGERKAPTSDKILRVVASKTSSSIGPGSLGWKLSTQELSAALSHHLISVHMKHRPAAMFGGMLQLQWDNIGHLSTQSRGNNNEMDSIEQALVALGIADGARLSTHSAVIGSSRLPTPQFGTFSSVDEHLVTLGRRRRSAVDCMNTRAMQLIDGAVASKEGIAPATKMNLLWIGVAVLVETPSMRAWCRKTSVECARLMIECMDQDRLGREERLLLNERADFIVLFESVRSISFGMESPLTPQEYLAALPHAMYPLPSPFRPTHQDFDLLLRPSVGTPDFQWIRSFAERLFDAGRLQLAKVAFLFLYGKGVIGLPSLVNLTWDGLKGTYMSTDAFIDAVLGNPLYAEVERSRGTSRWPMWIGLNVVFTHFVRAESILASLLVGAHLRLVNFLGASSTRQTFLATSQKSCYLALRRMDFITGLRDLVFDYHDFDPLITVICLIATLPEGGPCNTISLKDFPNLLHLFQFMAFSNAECGEFLERHGPSIVSADAGFVHFVDGTTPLDLPPRGQHLPSLPSSNLSVFDMDALILKALSHSPAVTPKSIPDAANQMVLATLDVLADLDHFHDIATTLVASTLGSLSDEESVVSTQRIPTVPQSLEAAEGLSSQIVHEALATL